MKYLLTILTALNVITMTAQKTYTTTTDANGSLIFTGFITKEVLAYEPSFVWFAKNTIGYNPSPNIVTAIKAAADKVQLIVYGGTWCEDTQNILPKLYTLLTLAGYNQANLTVIGVDRAKNTYSNLAKAMAITNVPTIVVMQAGKELGRVVEYGKTGKWDTELAEIISTTK